MRGKIRYMSERREACSSYHPVCFHASSISQFQMKIFPITSNRIHIGLVNIWHILLLIPLAIFKESLYGDLPLLENVMHFAKAVKSVFMCRIGNSHRTPSGL